MAGSDQAKSAWNSTSITLANTAKPQSAVREHAIHALGPREPRGRRDRDRLRDRRVHVGIAAADDLLVEIAPGLQCSRTDAGGVGAQGRIDAGQVVARTVVQREQQPDGPGASCRIRERGRTVGHGGRELGDVCLSLRPEACRCTRWPPLLDGSAYGCSQLAQAFPARRDDGNDLGADRSRQPRERHLDTLSRGGVASC